MLADTISVERHATRPVFLRASRDGRGGAAATAAAQLPDVPTPDTLGANFRHDSVGTSTPTDFDFLDGKWNIRFQSRKSPTEFNPAVAGTWSAHRTHDGLVIEDEFSLVNPNDGSRSLTLTYRVYNKARKTWEIAGDGREAGQPVGARHIVERRPRSFRRADVRHRRERAHHAHSLLRRHARSLPLARRRIQDGGKTWIRDFWKIEANRARE